MDAISKSTYEKMDSESKLNVLFDYAVDAHKCASTTKNNLEALEKKFDTRKRVDTTVAAIAGFFGGVVAHIGQWLIGGKTPGG